jgi:hypothetical protein
LVFCSIHSVGEIGAGHCSLTVSLLSSSYHPLVHSEQFFLSYLYFCGVDIATGYGPDDRLVAVRVPIESRIFVLQVVQTGSAVHPTSYPMGIGGSFPRGVKWPGRKADH